MPPSAACCASPVAPDVPRSSSVAPSAYGLPTVYKTPPSHPSGWRGRSCWGCGDDARQAASAALSAHVTTGPIGEYYFAIGLLPEYKKRRALLLLGSKFLNAISFNIGPRPITHGGRQRIKCYESCYRSLSYWRYGLRCTASHLLSHH